jgi:hypothetical protein
MITREGEQRLDIAQWDIVGPAIFANCSTQEQRSNVHK